MKFFLSNLGRMLRRLFPPLIGLAVLVLVIVWMSGGLRAKISPDEEEKPAPIGEHPWTLARTIRTVETVDAVGAIQPSTKTILAGQLLATIIQINVKPGDRVQINQPLVVLDDRELKAQKRAAEAAVAAAQANLTKCQNDFTRYQMMFAENAVTREDFDRVENAYRVAQAVLKGAREQAGRIDVLLTHTRIKAPAAGIVSHRHADPGDLAAPGKPLLALYDPGDLELHANVREALAGTIRIGMKLSVHIDSAGLDLEGQVREIVPQASEASRSILVKIALPPDKTRGLYMGMFGRVSIPVGHADRVVVPAQAVRIVGQLELIEVLGPKGPERRFVRTGRRLGDQWEILSGLQGGEKVILPSPSLHGNHHVGTSK